MSGLAVFIFGHLIPIAIILILGIWLIKYESDGSRRKLRKITGVVLIIIAIVLIIAEISLPLLLSSQKLTGVEFEATIIDYNPCPIECDNETHRRSILFNPYGWDFAVPDDHPGDPTLVTIEGYYHHDRDPLKNMNESHPFRFNGNKSTMELLISQVDDKIIITFEDPVYLYYYELTDTIEFEYTNDSARVEIRGTDGTISVNFTYFEH